MRTKVTSVYDQLTTAKKPVVGGKMLEIGEIKRARELGRTSGKGSSRYIWAPCGNCGQSRWVHYIRGNALYKLCHKCAVRLCNTGSGNPMWKGGRYERSDGYIRVYLPANDPFHLMADKDNCVLEHRLVMAKHLGRCLQTWELIHHINHIRDDNRIENLQIILADKHHQLTILETRIERLEERVALQNKEIKLLKWWLQQEESE